MSTPTTELCGYVVPIKYFSLVVLVLQNSALFLALRASRTQETLYNPGTAVICSESCKLLASLGLMMYEEGGFEGMITRLKLDILGKPAVTLKLMVPAALYTLQNSLLFLGATYLDAATFQVTYQLKILTTALFSVILLGKRLTPMQWLSLVSLMIGVVLIQMPEKSSEGTDRSSAEKILGLTMVLIACFSSGFAGVYFEKVLKGETAGIWVMNVQLASFSILIAFVSLMYRDSETIMQQGFFYGYNNWAFAAISLQAFGGLVVAVVVKYADNILKGFATSLSIVFSCIISIYFFEFVITTRFFFGTIFVLGATYVYGAFAAAKPVRELPRTVASDTKA